MNKKNLCATSKFSEADIDNMRTDASTLAYRTYSGRLVYFYNAAKEITRALTCYDFGTEPNASTVFKTFKDEGFLKTSLRKIDQAGRYLVVEHNPAILANVSIDEMKEICKTHEQIV